MSAQLDNILAQAANDPDVMETQEWLDALESVIEHEGAERAHYLLERMVDLARRRGARCIAMGLGYIGRLRVLPARRRAVNRAVEQGA